MGVEGAYGEEENQIQLVKRWLVCCLVCENNGKLGYDGRYSGVAFTASSVGAGVASEKSMLVYTM